MGNNKYGINVLKWNPVELAAKYDMEQIKDLNKAVREEADLVEKDRGPDNGRYDGIYLYSRKTRKKLDVLAWAITYKMQQDK